MKPIEDGQSLNLQRCIQKMQQGGLNPDENAIAEFWAKTLDGDYIHENLDGSAFNEKRFLIGLLQQAWERGEAYGAESVRKSLRQTLGVNEPD